MATYTDSHGFNKGSAGHSAKGLTRMTMEEVTLDFAKITTARSTAGATALAAGDIIFVIQVTLLIFGYSVMVRGSDLRP